MDMPTFLSHDRARCSLIVPGREHIDLALKLQNEPISRQYLARYFPIGMKQEEEWIDKANTSTSDAVFIIVNKDDHKTPIGIMGQHKIDWKNRRATTGAVMLEEYCGKGLGTDAKMLLLSWAFFELGLLKVESRVIAFNDRSQAYSRKCGYVQVGRLRRHQFRRGRYHDEIIMEVHGRGWRKLWKRFEKGTFHRKKNPPKVQTSHSIAWKLEG